MKVCLYDSLEKTRMMEKGEGIGKVSFLCIIIADAIILGAVVAYVIDIQSRRPNIRRSTTIHKVRRDRQESIQSKLQVYELRR